MFPGTLARAGCLNLQTPLAFPARRFDLCPLTQFANPVLKPRARHASRRSQSCPGALSTQQTLFAETLASEGQARRTARPSEAAADRPPALAPRPRADADLRTTHADNAPRTV